MDSLICNSSHDETLIMLLERVSNLEDKFIDKSQNKLALYALKLIINNNFNNNILNVLRIIYKDIYLNKTSFVNLEHTTCIKELCMTDNDYQILIDSGFYIWKGVLPHYGYEMTFISIDNDLSLYVKKSLQKYFSRVEMFE